MLGGWDHRTSHRAAGSALLAVPPLAYIHLCARESVRNGNEAAIVRRFARQVGLSLRSNKKDSLRGQRAAVCLTPIIDRADQRTGPQANPFGRKVSVRHFRYVAD